MPKRVLYPLLATLLVIGIAGRAAGRVDALVAHAGDDRVPPQCRINPECGLWAYWESQGSTPIRPRTTDTAGVGHVLDNDTWEYTDTIRYGRGAQGIGSIFVLVNLSVDDQDRHRLFFLMRSEVESGPPVRMTHS